MSYVYWTLIAIHFLQVWLLTYTFLLFLSSLACTEIDILYCAIQMIQFISHLRHKTFHSLHWINYFDGLCVWIITHFNWFCEACMNPTSENERFNFNKNTLHENTIDAKCKVNISSSFLVNNLIWKLFEIL